MLSREILFCALSKCCGNFSSANPAPSMLYAIFYLSGLTFFFSIEVLMDSLLATQTCSAKLTRSYSGNEGMLYKVLRYF